MKVLFATCLLFAFSVRDADFAATKAAKCRTSSQCADSGTICKTGNSHDAAEPGDAQSESAPTPEDPSSQLNDAGESDDANDAFDPPTADDVEVSDDDDSSDEFGDVVVSDDVDAVVADPTDDPKKLKLKKGVKVTPAKSDAAKGEIKVGSKMVINGWDCVVTAISQPKDSKNKGAGVSADVLSDFDGSTQPEQNDAAADGKLSAGKILKVGPLSCKITGQVKKPNSGATTRASVTTKSQATKKAVTTFKPSVGLGTCNCEPAKRFACTNDDDCFTRFREKSVICFPTSICKTDIGPGYCRRKGVSVLDDEGDESA